MLIVCNQIEKKISNEFKIGPLSLTIEPGTVNVLVGTNGSGKSSLIRTIAGLIQPDKGMIDRFNLLEEEWREHLAFVPQSSKGFEKYTLQHLASIHAVGFRGWDNERFSILVKRYNLPLNKTVGEMSGGMQRRVLVVLALARNSTVLIMDEPLAGVDMAAQELMQEDWLAYLEGDPKRAILFATHVADEIKDYADYIFLMKRGSIVARYEKDTLFRNYARFWTNEQLEVVRNLTGITYVIQRGPQVEIISDNRSQTESDMNRLGLEITMKQSLKVAEILRILLKEGEEVNDTYY